MNEHQRLFFALWPTPEQQTQWFELGGQWLPHGVGKRTRAETLHITLLFVGEVEPEMRDCLIQMADEIQAPAFTILLDKAGHWRRPQVVWWGVDDVPDALILLVEKLRKGLSRCGLSPESRPYQAHLTVARKVSNAPGRLQPPSVPWSVDSFSLIQSTLTPQGAQYNEIKRWSLK